MPFYRGDDVNSPEYTHTEEDWEEVYAQAEAQSARDAIAEGPDFAPPGDPSYVVDRDGTEEWVGTDSDDVNPHTGQGLCFFLIGQ